MNIKDLISCLTEILIDWYLTPFHQYLSHLIAVKCHRDQITSNDNSLFFVMGIVNEIEDIN